MRSDWLFVDRPGAHYVGDELRDDPTKVEPTIEAVG
jgi:hypothetical protein